MRITNTPDEGIRIIRRTRNPRRPSKWTGHGSLLDMAKLADAAEHFCMFPPEFFAPDARNPKSYTITLSPGIAWLAEMLAGETGLDMNELISAALRAYSNQRGWKMVNDLAEQQARALKNPPGPVPVR